MKWGVVLNAKKPVPVYHRPHGETTHCGRKIGFLASWLPEHHLKRFSVRCRGCYPR